jgi:hypothetical protein
MDTNENKKIVSQHIFLFPFTVRSDKDFKDFWENLEKKNDKWERLPFSFKEDANLRYNEWVYFYDYVRKSLFDTEPEKNSEKENPFVKYFAIKRDIIKNSHIVYHLASIDKNGKCKKDWKIFDLTINNISLFLFRTNVGVLSIELLNYKQKDDFIQDIDNNQSNNWYEEFKDTLLINDFGRRIYPQFIGKANGNNNDDNDCSKGTGVTKNTFLADKIEFYLGTGAQEVEEFKTEDYLNEKIKSGMRFPKYFNLLLGDLKDKIVPLIDDRMYTVCWYGNNVLSKDLTQKTPEEEYKFLTSEDWYKYVYIDGKDIGVANKKMMKALNRVATYDRWADYGTLFGITRYSLVALTDESYFSYTILREHMRGVYYLMAVLLLAQRASIVHFFDKVTEISQVLDELRNKKENKDKNKDKNKEKDKEHMISVVLEQVTSLYSSLIEFESRLHFAEVTPQEQGIEMYKKAYKIMGIDELSDDLKYEVEKLHNFIDLQNNKENSESLTKIQNIVWISTILGVWLKIMDCIVPSQTLKVVIIKCILTIIIIILLAFYFLEAFKKDGVKLIAKIRRK